mmetsp:Transcript_35634/g.100890  ORF Transcript_35634/g.100890 Transcript_35634/m.100890 type:complete len:90 (+) Transcript_35634:214-483(+)
MMTMMHLSSVRPAPIVAKGGSPSGGKKAGGKSGGSGKAGGESGKAGGGGSANKRPGAGKGLGPGDSKAGWPSTTENPSGGDRSVNPPRQ